MDSRSRTLADRFGKLHAHATFVQAALVAAHGAAPVGHGFRASDVRFFFLLFTNWVEHDVLRPGQDLDLTQVRRVFERLSRDGWLEVVALGRGPRATRNSRHALTQAGLLGLTELLVDVRVRRPFEEVVFVACFARSYRGAILARVRGERPQVTPAARRSLADLLDAGRILRAAAQTVGEVQRDLEGRIAASAVMFRTATAARAEGAGDAEVAARLERLDPYQLHRVRPFTEVIGGLADDLRAFELGEALTVRARVLFEPLLAQARAQRAILEALETNVAAPDDAPSAAAVSESHDASGASPARPVSDRKSDFDRRQQ